MLSRIRSRHAFAALLFALTCGAFLMGGIAQAAEAGAEAGEHAYIGVKKCKMCHKKPDIGEQFGLWEKRAHANAFATLATEKALADAKSKGIDNPQEAPECLKCHATAYAVMADLANQKITMEEGVSCESCHGPGADYKSKKTMVGIRSGEIDGAPLGLIQPTEEVCVACHQAEGNSFYQEFDYEARCKDIAHMIPAAAAE